MILGDSLDASLLVRRTSEIAFMNCAWDGVAQVPPIRRDRPDGTSTTLLRPSSQGRRLLVSDEVTTWLGLKKTSTGRGR